MAVDSLNPQLLIQRRGRESGFDLSDIATDCRPRKANVLGPVFEAWSGGLSGGLEEGDHFRGDGPGCDYRRHVPDAR